MRDQARFAVVLNSTAMQTMSHRFIHKHRRLCAGHFVERDISTTLSGMLAAAAAFAADQYSTESATDEPISCTGCHWLDKICSVAAAAGIILPRANLDTVS